MKIHISLGYFLAFVSLVFVLHELHEIVHTTVGRLICGCWGKRDFNVWTLCEGCGQGSKIGLVATLAGPVFTYFIIWRGYFLLKNTEDSLKSLGLSLIFGSMPFARLLSVVLNASDETYILRKLGLKSLEANVIGTVLTFLILWVPLKAAYTTIKNKNRLLWFSGFLVLPVVIDLLVVLGFLNMLLSKGILDSYWILGSPMIVTFWTVIVFLLLVLTKNHLFRLTQNRRNFL